MLSGWLLPQLAAGRPHMLRASAHEVVTAVKQTAKAGEFFFVMSQWVTEEE